MKRFAKVRLELDSQPESVALVRAAVSGLAEYRELDAEVLNDVKTAVSEACNNVVVHAYAGDCGPLAVDLDADCAGVSATVRDSGVGFQALGERDDGMGVGLAVISALAARAEFATAADGGTEARMWFPVGAHEARPLVHFAGPRHVGPSARQNSTHDRLTSAVDLPGAVRVTVSPVSLTAPVLGRLARALAATARFSFDRFSDVYLVADALSAHARAAAPSDRISFSLVGTAKQLELSIGPFERGTGVRLQRRCDDEREPDSPLALLADEVTVGGDEQSETLHVVLRDRSERARPAHDY